MTILSLHKDGSQAPAGSIFVFGSNLSGIHGGGAARAAWQHYGAAWGVGIGPTGQSYAIPTVAKNISGPLPLDEIEAYVEAFLRYARKYGAVERFFVTRVGCGLAGYTDAEIAPMFRGAPPNCSFAEEWRPYLA